MRQKRLSLLVMLALTIASPARSQDIAEVPAANRERAYAQYEKVKSILGQAEDSKGGQRTEKVEEYGDSSTGRFSVLSIGRAPVVKVRLDNGVLYGVDWAPLVAGRAGGGDAHPAARATQSAVVDKAEGIVKQLLGSLGDDLRLRQVSYNEADDAWAVVWFRYSRGLRWENETIRVALVGWPLQLHSFRNWVTSTPFEGQTVNITPAKASESAKSYAKERILPGRELHGAYEPVPTAEESPIVILPAWLSARDDGAPVNAPVQRPRAAFKVRVEFKCVEAGPGGLMVTESPVILYIDAETGAAIGGLL